MKTVGSIAIVLSLLAQPLDLSPRELLNLERPLTPPEIAAVLSASREALALKTLRLSPASIGKGTEVLMASGGRPKVVRNSYASEGGVVSGVSGSASRPAEIQRWRETVIDVVFYTGRPARKCDASAEQGELVIEYTFSNSTRAWTATARRDSDVRPTGVEAFEMLRTAGGATTGVRRAIGRRSARALVAVWTAPPEDSRSLTPRQTGDPLPNAVGVPAPNDATVEARQLLWIDTDSLLPLRWELSKRGSVVYGFDFVYEAIDLRLPEVLEIPGCIR